MKDERFVIVIHPQYNLEITEEALRKFLEDNWGPGSFTLITVPADKSYSLSAYQKIEDLEDLGINRVAFEELK